jgi:hypothetical protein
MGGEGDGDLGCAYLLDGAGGRAGRCGCERRPGSSYCVEHHALCHLPRGSAAERRELEQVEALATIVGGRQGRPSRDSPPAVLHRLDRLSRLFLRPHRSRNVPGAAMPKHAASKPETPAAADLGPTPERHRQGRVERLAQPIADAAGHPAQPYRAVDTLVVMERRGSISAGMRQAGEDFRARFAVAQLDPLRAIDLSHLRIAEPRLRRDNDGPGSRIEAARGTVWRAIQAVGGIASPAGSCLWHVLGWQQSLKEWAQGQGWSGRRVSQEAASGILIAALGALETHLGYHRILRKNDFSVDKSGLI